MSGVRGNPATLQRFARKLVDLPVVVAQAVAADAAPALSSLASASYDGGNTVYGEGRPSGIHGQKLSLVATGAARASLGFVSVGRIVRARLGQDYARFLVGKFRVLPMGAMPVEWSATIDEKVQKRIPLVLGAL